MCTLKSRSFLKFKKNSARVFLSFSSGPSFITIWEIIHSYDDFYYKRGVISVGIFKKFRNITLTDSVTSNFMTRYFYKTCDSIKEGRFDRKSKVEFAAS